MKKQKIKTIEGRIWKLCRAIIRYKYGIDKCFICGNEVTELKKLHTAHLFKKETLPLQLKYSLRILRPCCYTCNRSRHGNEGWFVVRLIEEEGLEYLNHIIYDIRNLEDITSTPLKREFLLDLEQEYATLWESYQRTTTPVN